MSAGHGRVMQPSATGRRAVAEVLEEVASPAFGGGASGGSSSAGYSHSLSSSGSPSACQSRMCHSHDGFAAIRNMLTIFLSCSSSRLSSDSSSTPSVPLTPAQSSQRIASSSSAAAAASSSAAPKPTIAKFGVSGSNVILADGTEGFAYQNDFGGYWGWDADQPFDTNAGGRSQRCAQSH